MEIGSRVRKKKRTTRKNNDNPIFTVVAIKERTYTLKGSKGKTHVAMNIMEQLYEKVK